MNSLLPAVLSTTAGAVDVIGFLALGGLFYVTGGFSQVGPLLAAPMLGVAAMAIQNALVRVALPGSPSTAVMTI